MSNEYRCMHFLLWALALGVLTACTKPNPASCADDFCSDPAGASLSGFGGNGGCFESDARNGRKGGSLPGAGGGSAGFLLTYTPLRTAPILDPQTASPSFESNGAIATN